MNPQGKSKRGHLEELRRWRARLQEGESEASAMMRVAMREAGLAAQAIVPYVKKAEEEAMREVRF